MKNNSSRVLLILLFATESLFSATVLPRPDRGGAPESKLYDYGVMGPPATAAQVAAADAAVTGPVAQGPFAPTWDSIEKNYRVPAWFQEAKFGIFLHWGVYSAAAHHNEWYEKHMYGSRADIEWHEENFGPVEKVGYKDLIPRFTAARWDPDAWALLFKRAGAKFVIPTAQHHDNFALWDSKVTRFNAQKMGPRRDLVGELAAAVRRQGLKFGVSNHGIENFTFINPAPDVDARLAAAKADLYDPEWAEFYHVADRRPEALTKFLTDWVNRNLELVDQYQPDILWFDNGVNLRVLDPLKLRVAAHYYNRARDWGKEVTISTKYIAYAPSNDDAKQIGSILDFEKVGTRSPKDIRSGPWLVDDTIGSTWGYTEGMSVAGPGSILVRLIDTVSKGGSYLLNLSPMADGTIPPAQQDTLLGIGAWLDLNGEGIYGTHPWKQFGEGGAQEIRFTTKGDTLYAISLSWPNNALTIASLTSGSVGRISRVELLGHAGSLDFSQDDSGLKIRLPETRPGRYAWVFKIAGGKPSQTFAPNDHSPGPSPVH